MKFRTFTGKLIAGGAIAAAAIALPATAMAAPATAARPASAHASCRFQQIKVWLGIGNGTSTARTTSYPLEFSNVGRFTCSVYGHPGVSGYRNGHQIGPAAIHYGSKFLVNLPPGYTGHARLTIRSAGSVSGCARVPSTRLRVFAPNQSGATIINGFVYTACRNRTTLSVSAVLPGTGIPGLHV
jgi:hypothetical protein